MPTEPVSSGNILWINGDTTYGTGLQFDGLDKLITSNVVDMGSQPLTLTALTTMCRTIANVGGKPQAIVLSYYDNQRISDLILGSYYRLFQQGPGAMADIPAGIAVSRWLSPFGQLDIVAERYIQENYGLRKAYVIDDKTMTDDGNAIAMVDLMPTSSIDLAITATAYKTLIAEFTVLMMTIEVFQGVIENIARA